MSNSSSPPVRSIERILAYMIAGIIGVSILSFLAVIVGTFVGVSREAFGLGFWPIVANFPKFGLPVGFLLIVVLLVMNLRKRAKGAPKAP